MASVTAVPTESPFPLITLPKVHSIPMLCTTIFFVCDAAAITLTGCLVLLSKPGGGTSALDLHRYLALWPALGIFMAIFVAARLYPAVIHNAVTELRRLGLALTLSFLVIAWLIVVTRGAITAGAIEPRSRVLFLWWMLTMTVTPLCRSVVRDLFCHRPWWGIPVAVFHTGDTSADIIRELEAHPEIGLRPVVILASPVTIRPRHRLPVLDVRDASAVRASGVERVMIAVPDTGFGRPLLDLEMFETIFPHLMILNSSAALYNLSVDARQLGGCLAVEVRRDLLLRLPRLTKRALDLFIVALVSPGVMLTIFLLSVLVRLESPGPVFFGHPRIGRDRTMFRAWKIRTMQVNGKELLEKALAQDASMREEWLRNRKLRRDPRITRVGRFIRRASLDELPQLWNVLMGEMSLVGPRPIVEEEVATYGQSFPLYCRVTPGITGLWQVSGRNTISVPERVRLDSYYVRNWSLWLDLHILVRTARVVLSGQGAY
jgi:Undecaprenyl-phosphate galactose phosphotransferase WbaP